MRNFNYLVGDKDYNLCIGKQGENNVTKINFDYSEWQGLFGEGTLTLLVKRPTDTAPYPVDLTLADGIATWNISQTDLRFAGMGACELNYVVDDSVVKSNTYTICIAKALGMGTTPPDPWEDWLNQILEAASAAEGYSRDAEESATSAEGFATSAESAKDAAVEAANHYPYIRESDKHWMVWDVEGGEYVDTGIVAEGQGGGGTGDHTLLSNRDANDQHPISAITGLQTALDGKQPSGDYATSEELDAIADEVDGKQDAITSANKLDYGLLMNTPTIPSIDGLATEQYVDDADAGLQEQIDALVSKSDVVDVVGTYAELQAYDTSALGNNDVVKVLDDSTHSNARSYYRWVITGTTGAWEYIGSEAVGYTKAETDTLLNAKQNTITDLATIRSGAAAGATAVQPSALNAYRTASSQDTIDNGKISKSAQASKTSAMTNEVGIDTNGKLWAAGGGGGSGGTIAETTSILKGDGNGNAVAAETDQAQEADTQAVSELPITTVQMDIYEDDVLTHTYYLLAEDRTV